MILIKTNHPYLRVERHKRPHTVVDPTASPRCAARRWTRGLVEMRGGGSGGLVEMRCTWMDSIGLTEMRCTRMDSSAFLRLVVAWQKEEDALWAEMLPTLKLFMGE
jgi:hypothetical protein